MRLPDNLHVRPYPEWNHLVRGLMEAWEVARLLGEEQELEKQVADDPDGKRIERLGEAGNMSAQRSLDCGRIAQIRAPDSEPVLLCLRAHSTLRR